MKNPETEQPLGIIQSNFRMEDLHYKLCLDAANLIAAKNHDYTAGGSPFANFEMASVIGIDPRKGILLRMLDKIKRLETATQDELRVKNESVRDSVLDIINYAVLYYGLHCELIDNKAQAKE